METKVLVAYATSYGSTKEIAEVISETLRESTTVPCSMMFYEGIKKLPFS